MLFHGSTRTHVMNCNCNRVFSRIKLVSFIFRMKRKMENALHAFKESIFLSFFSINPHYILLLHGINAFHFFVGNHHRVSFTH